MARRKLDRTRSYGQVYGAPGPVFFVQGSYSFDKDGYEVLEEGAKDKSVGLMVQANPATIEAMKNWPSGVAKEGPIDTSLVWFALKKEVKRRLGTAPVNKKVALAMIEEAGLMP